MYTFIMLLSKTPKSYSYIKSLDFEQNINLLKFNGDEFVVGASSSCREIAFWEVDRKEDLNRIILEDMGEKYPYLHIVFEIDAHDSYELELNIESFTRFVKDFFGIEKIIVKNYNDERYTLVFGVDVRKTKIWSPSSTTKLFFNVVTGLLRKKWFLDILNNYEDINSLVTSVRDFVKEIIKNFEQEYEYKFVQDGVDTLGESFSRDFYSCIFYGRTELEDLILAAYLIGVLLEKHLSYFVDRYYVEYETGPISSFSKIHPVYAKNLLVTVAFPDITVQDLLTILKMSILSDAEYSFDLTLCIFNMISYNARIQIFKKIANYISQQ